MSLSRITAAVTADIHFAAHLIGKLRWHLLFCKVCIGFRYFPVCETLTNKMPDALRFRVKRSLPQFLQNQPDIFRAITSSDHLRRRCR